MTTLCFYAQFTSLKVGKDALTPTWNVEQITRSDGTRTALVTAGANSITIGRNGLYGYLLAGADLTLYDYVATAVTTDATVDAKEIPALWTFWASSWHDVATSLLTIVGSIGKWLMDSLHPGVSVTVVSPILATGNANIQIGDDYFSVDGRALAWSSSSWPTLTGGSVVLKVAGQTITGTLTEATKTASFDVTKAQTAAIPAASNFAEIIATLANGHVVTLASVYITAS